MSGTVAPTILHVVEAGTETPDRATLSEAAGVSVTGTETRAAAVDRATDGAVACLVVEASDPNWLFDVVAAVRERVGPVPVVVRSTDHDPSLSVECGRRAGVEYLPRADEAATDVSLLDRVRERANDDGAHGRGDRQVLSRVSDAFFAVDEEWTLTYVNDRFEELLGVGRDQLLGEELWESFPAAVDRDFYTEARRAMETQQPVQFEEFYPPLSTWFAVRVYPDESGLSVYFQDVTERRERERTLAERERVFREMYRVVAEKGRPLAEKVDELLALGRDALDAEYAALSRVEGDDYVFEHVHDPGGEVEPGDVVPLGATNCERAIATEETLVLADVAADAPELTDRAGFTDMGIRCYLGTPVEVDGEVVGTFCFYDDEPREEPFTDWEVTLVELLGNWVSHERERQRRRRELEEFETVLETLEEPVFAVDEDLRFSLVTDPLAERLGVDRRALLGEPLGSVLDEETAAACRALADGDDAVDAPVEGLATPPDGDRYPAAVELTALSGEEFTGGVGTIRDVTERRERARELEFYYELVEEAGVAVVAVDERGELAYVNPAFADLAGRSADELQGTPVWELVAGADPSAFADRWRPMALGDTVAFETRADGVDLGVRATKGEIRGTPYLFGTVADVTSRRDRERALARLQETAGDLLEADDPAAVADCALSAATDILSAPFVAVYRHDRETGALEPTAVSDPASEAVDEMPTFTGGDGLAWQTFVDGEPATYDDVSDEPGVYDPDTPIRRAMMLPLGTHGVLLVGDREPGAFPDQDEEFARTLAANVEVALDRAASREQLRRSERELAERTGQLEELDRINRVIRRTARAVVQASTREGIESAVCDRFAAVDPFEFAWVGRPGPAGETVAPSQWAGDGGQPARDGDVAVDDGPDAHPVAAAVATGEVAVRTDLLADAHGEAPDWCRTALAHGYQSCCAVPFTYEGVTRGVLMLYAREADAFADEVQSVLDELGAMLGYALAAVERRDALASPGVTELEFDVAGTDLPCRRVAAALDCRVAFKRVDDPTANAPAVTYAVEGADAGDVSDVLPDLPGVEDVRSVAVDDDVVLVEVRRSRPWYGATFAREGGAVVAATAEPGEATLTVRLPAGIDVRRLVDSFRTDHPSASVTAQRERDAPPAEPLELSRVLSGVLTDRQHAALETAYHSGYFDRPRRANGEDVAALLDVSQPTFSEHLRRAEGRTFAMLFDGEGLDGRGG